MQNKDQANDLKNATYTSLMSGIIAREQAKQMKLVGAEDIETAFVTAMFHSLGKLLAIYYFPEDYEAMKTLVANKGVDEDHAMRSVLGVSYEDLGRGIAKEWKLPDVISEGMQSMPEGSVPPAKNFKETIKQLSSFSNELCAITGNDDDNSETYTKLVARYKDSLKINEKSINTLLESSIKEAEEFTRVLNIDTSKATVFNNIRKKTEKKEEENKWSTEVKEKQSSKENGVIIETIKVEPKATKETQHDILVNGTAEITNSLIGNFNLNDILTMVLETIYRGMGFNRVLFAIHDPRNNQVMARFGLGKNIDEIIPDFRYKIDDSDDVFVSTIKTGKEFVILDVNSEEYKNRIPSWIKKLAMPTTVVLYPLMIDKRCLGLIYADNDDSNIKISMEALGFFKSLRNQASLAIHQKKNNAGG